MSTLDGVGSAPVPADVPRWLRDIESSLPVRAQFVLTGNVRDIHLLPPPPDSGGRTAPRRLPTVEALWEVLSRSGYECLVVHDPVDHLTVHPPTDAARQAAVDVVGPLDSGRDVGLARLAEIVRAVTTTRAHRIALVLDYASRLTVNPQTLEDDEHRFLVACEKASHLALPLYVDGVRPGPLYNPLFWIVSSERDLPAWLLLRNEAIKTVSIPLPDLDERLRLAALLVPSLPDARETLAAQDRTPRAGGVAPEESVIDRAVRRFAEQSEAMTLGSMVEISRLAIERRLPVTDIEDAVRAYRVGMLDNPWKRPLLRDRIRAGDAELARHVLGQQRAIHKVVDVLIRSATGLTAAHSAGHASRPRGILFFAGPTGVGKTELAKGITRLVFGSEDAYTRFDMSEFSAEHSEARLIGAPPGYIGHDAGGQLTNGVREKPFSLVLFDEIEKAHPRILDKFLQILEDGRLTDGSGSTVHFSETLLVFTSNLGIYTEGPDGERVLNVSVETPRAELEAKMRAAITEHFTVQLNRPELLNRIGDNIIVFDFITPDVGRQLVDHYLRNVAQRVEKEMGLVLQVAPEAREVLVRCATQDLSFGGRGIGSVLESILVNPLARALFMKQLPPGRTVVVTGVETDDEFSSVTLS